jgi:hypothetical protein
MCIWSVNIQAVELAQCLSRKWRTWCSGQDTNIRGQLCLSRPQDDCTCIYCVNFTLCLRVPYNALLEYNVFPSMFFTMHSNLKFICLIMKLALIFYVVRISRRHRSFLCYFQGRPYWFILTLFSPFFPNKFKRETVHIVAYRPVAKQYSVNSGRCYVRPATCTVFLCGPRRDRYYETAR